MKQRLLLAWLPLLTAASAHAAEPDPAPAPPSAPSELVSPQPVSPQPVSPEPPKPAAKPSSWKGFRIASDDGAFELKIGGQLQVDAWGFPGDDAKAYIDEVRLRRSRLQLRAKVATHYDFRLLLDFADARLQILDAVFETTFLDALRLRLGKEKSPVSFDRLQSAASLLFLERSPTVSVATNRDLGLQLAGRLGDGLVDYQLGLWNGTPDGASVDQDVEDDFDFAGRVTVQPFVKAKLPALANLQVGVSGSIGDAKGTQAAPNLATYRSSGRATWFKYVAGTDLATTAIADGSRTRLGGHLLWRHGPALVFGEAIRSTQEVTLAERTESIAALAWSAQAAFVLTGEDAAWNGVKPARPFDPSRGGAGAFELAVRWGELAIDDLAFDAGFAEAGKSARRSRTLTVGLNWYLDSAVKVQLDYERTAFEGGAADAGDRPTEHLVGARAQLLF